jgi:sporulation protein YlmC with PRC-barrel domain
MLQLANSLANIPVMSLRTGGMVATAERPLIDPNNLKIEGWYCRDHFSKNELILLTKDIRDIIPQGFAIDDYEVLSEAHELVRLKDVLELDFELIGKPVSTDRKRRLGKVSDYATDVSSFFIMKLYISQPVYKTISGGQLSIDRTQIVEISPRHIVVKDVDEKIHSPAPALIGIR